MDSTEKMQMTPEDIDRLTAKSWADYNFLMGCYGQAIIPMGGFHDPQGVGKK